MARAFSSSYLSGDAAARAFIPADFREATTRATLARAAAQRAASPALIAALRAQDATLPPSPARQQNLNALADGQTAVVATGQQVGLFLGPLYSFYKAASAVAVARTIQAQSGVRCVPLFWLQTEDHDWAEIAGCTIAGAHGAPAQLTLASDGGADGRVSVAHRHLGPEIDGLLDALAETLGPGPAADETVAILRAHYTPGRPVAAAFAGVMATLFASEGLIVFDPRQAPVAALAAPLYRRALQTAGAIEQRLEQRRAALDAAGFDEQIALRRDCSLLFFHPEGPTGPRFRLQRRTAAGDDGTGWCLAGHPATLTDVQIQARLDAEPLAFSTSALLRPIVQDALLPTVAYVGGPGEINYFGQLAPVYEHFAVAMPLVVPRGRFRCLDAGTRRTLEQLGLHADDVALPRAQLAARLPSTDRTAGPSTADLRRQVEQQLMPLVDTLTRATLDVDPASPQLARAAARTRASVAHAVSRLLDRRDRRLAERDTVTTQRLERLQAVLCPQGVPQERCYGWPSLAGRHGWQTLKHLVMDHLETDGPFSTALRDLRP